MTNGYPGAFDTPQLLLDGVDAVTGEDWTELADATGACGAVAGNLGTFGSAWQHVGKILQGLRKIASGIVSASSSSFAGTVAISFPANVFTAGSALCVVAFRAETGSVGNDNSTPLTFSASSITTSGANLAGWTETGSAPSGSTTVRVAWIAFQTREAPAFDPESTSPFAFTPDVLPPVLSGFDAIRSEIPTAVASQIEDLTRATGKNPVGAAGGGGSWTDIATFLNAFDGMLVGFLSASAEDFDADGLGVFVGVDGTLFPNPSAVEVFVMSQTDGADSGSNPGQNYPIVFAVDSIAGGGAAPLTFRIRGWARNGNDPTVTDQIVVAYVIRNTIGAPA